MPGPEAPLDCVIIGGGIIGLATAHELLTRRPELRLVVLEKETGLAQHQSGRNSGVIHSGIYYRAGSLKAKLCQSGREQLLRFCKLEAIPHEVCGKLIVATQESQLSALAELKRRGDDNAVPSEFLDQRNLREFEPNARGLQALHIPAAGIVSFGRVARRLARRVQRRRHAQVLVASEVHAVSAARGMLTVQTANRNFTTRFVVNCAGLQADRIASLCGQKSGVRIVPFRGDYFVLTNGAEPMVKHLIYPVPDPSLPFLGVHATRTIAGHVECGPNASLALGREAYDKFSWDPRDLSEALLFEGVWRLIAKHPRTSLRELHQSFSKRAFLKALKQLLPQVELSQLRPRAAGIRAQALAKDGTLIDDFLVEETERVLSLCNAPSPAATSSFAIAETLSDRALAQLDR